jgi:hypothetical protein
MRPDINEIIAIQDFAVLFRWEVIFATLPSAIPNAGNYTSATLNAHAISSEYPRRTSDEIEQAIHGHKVYQAGMPTYEPITLTLVEDQNGLIQKFIRDWSNIIWTPVSGTQVPKSQYVCPTIILRPLKGDNSAIHTYILKNAWLQTYNIGNPDGGANETIKPELTLRYDYFIQS